MKPESVRQPSDKPIGLPIDFDEDRLSFDAKEGSKDTMTDTNFRSQDNIVVPSASLSSTKYDYEARIINYGSNVDARDARYNGKVRFLVLNKDGRIFREFLLWIPDAPVIAVAMDEVREQSRGEVEEQSGRRIRISLAPPPDIDSPTGPVPCGATCR